MTDLTRSDRIDDIKSHQQGEIRGLTKLVKIAEDVRKKAAQRGLTDAEAIEEGLKQKATEFNKAGAEIYAKT